MADEFGGTAFRDQLKALCPIVDNLRHMFGAARHAFNRHSQAELEELERLQDVITLDLDLVFEKVEAGLENPSGAGNPYLLKLQGVITHLEIIGANISAMADPIRRKIKQGAIFSDQDFFHLNNLFSHHTGFMRSLVDIFKLDDAALKAYVRNESQKLIEGCYQVQIDHETRMTDSLAQPGAYSIYISILEHSRVILKHLLDLVNLLE